MYFVLTKYKDKGSTINSNAINATSKVVIKILLYCYVVFCLRLLVSETK